jgi:hypothetical protein
MLGVDVIPGAWTLLGGAGMIAGLILVTLEKHSEQETV